MVLLKEIEKRTRLKCENGCFDLACDKKLKLQEQFDHMVHDSSTERELVRGQIQEHARVMIPKTEEFGLQF